MDKLDFAEGMKILSSCYHKDLSNDDFIIWYEMLKDIEAEVFKNTIIEICKEKQFMPTVHDILDKSKKVTNNYLLTIIDKMYKAGYFKKGVVELSDEQSNRNYDKTISWVEKGIIPQFLKDDINEFIKGNKKINNKEDLYKIIGPPGE